MFRDHFIEHCVARIAWFVGGNSRSHDAPYVQHRGCGYDRERHRTILRVVQVTLAMITSARDGRKVKIEPLTV